MISAAQRPAFRIYPHDFRTNRNAVWIFIEKIHLFS
jgi:hypothetical protein